MQILLWKRTRDGRKNSCGSLQAGIGDLQNRQRRQLVGSHRQLNNDSSPRQEKPEEKRKRKQGLIAARGANPATSSSWVAMGWRAACEAATEAARADLACQCPGKKNIELVLVMTAACVGFREPLGVDTNRRKKRVARVFLLFGCGFGFAGSVCDSW